MLDRLFLAGCSITFSSLVPNWAAIPAARCLPRKYKAVSMIHHRIKADPKTGYLLRLTESSLVDVKISNNVGISVPLTSESKGGWHGQRKAIRPK